MYVGGFPYSTTKEELTQLFNEVGEVTDIHLPMGTSESGERRPRGFGFIEMSDEDGKAAIERFNGTEFGGRRLTVNEAQPREQRPGGFQGRRDDRGGDWQPREKREWQPRQEQPAAAPAADAADADMASADDMDMPADEDTEEEAAA